jgi:hypothetical protein
VLREGTPPTWTLALACTTAAIAACWGDAGQGGTATKRSPLDVPSSWQLARLAPGHIVHVSQTHTACEQCHTIASGRFDNPGPASCAACHPKQSRIEHASARAQAQFGAGAQADCTDCHAFAAVRTPARPPAHAARAPHAANALLALDAGSVDAAWDCVRCHDGHSSVHLL